MTKTTHEKVIVLFACLTIIIAMFSMAIFTPSMPTIADGLHASAYLIQSSLTYFLIGYGVSQLIYGSLSDRYGRKVVLLIALGILLVGNIISMCAISGVMFVCSHAVAGLGAGCGSSITRALLRDTFQPGSKLTKAFASFALMATLSSATAPLIGSAIQTLFGHWRVVFLILALINLSILLTFIKFLPETINEKKQLKFVEMLKAYGYFLRQKQFMGHAIKSAIFFGFAVSFLIVSPFLFQHVLGLSVMENGYISLFFAGSMIAGVYLLKGLRDHFHHTTFIKTALIIRFIGVMVLLITGIFHHLDLLIMVITAITIYLSTGLSSSIFISEGLRSASQNTGAASALQGSIKTAGGGIIGFLAAVLPDHTQLPLAILYVGLTIFGTLVYWFLLRD